MLAARRARPVLGRAMIWMSRASHKNILPQQTPALSETQRTLSAEPEKTIVEPGALSPESTQLRAYFWTSMVPMLGFGFMDNTIMIHAGNIIDCTVGVKFGLSTLAAAALGQVVSAAGSITFGDTIERIARKIGLPSSGLTSVQRRLPISQRVAFAGSFIGVVLGAILGLVNLYFVDTKQSTLLKLEALRDEQEFEFEIDVSNKKRRDATTVTVKGPDVDGVLASLTAAITAHGYSLVELHASPVHFEGEADGQVVEDVFVLRPRGGGPKVKVDDQDLEDLGRVLLEACKDPLSAHSLKTQVKKLEAKNERLINRLEIMERVMEERQIKIEPSATVED